MLYKYGTCWHNQAKKFQLGLKNVLKGNFCRALNTVVVKVFGNEKNTQNVLIKMFSVFTLAFNPVVGKM